MITDTDRLDAIASGSRAVIEALETTPDGPVDGCGAWTVRDCAHHVGAAHHTVARVIAGRPDTTLRVFTTLDVPSRDDPSLGTWIADGTEALLDQLRTVDPDEPCWTPNPRAVVGFWPRRMANEVVVHRWDVERGAGVAVTPVDSAMAVDGIDEYVDHFVALTRRRHASPASAETFGLRITNGPARWVLALPEEGRREILSAPIAADVEFVGTAASLLLFLWQRVPAEALADPVPTEAEVTRWRELVPTV